MGKHKQQPMRGGQLNAPTVDTSSSNNCCPRMASGWAACNHCGMGTSFVYALLGCMLMALATPAASAGLDISQAHLLTNMSRWPNYVRGKNSYQWVLSEAGRQNGVTYMGTHTRLRLALDKLRRGQPITISALGGGITTLGDWTTFVANYLQDYWGKGLVKFHNGAVGSTTCVYAALCHLSLVPPDVDIVLIEYAYNDWSKPHAQSHALNRYEESLIRTLLSYPNRPAVMYVNTIPWRTPGSDNWWDTMESRFNELAYWYQVPSVSLRACCYHLLEAGTAPGFFTRHVEAPSDPRNFFRDAVHLGPKTGARVMAELVLHMLTTVLQGLRKPHPIKPWERQVAAAPLPPLLQPHSSELMQATCHAGDDFHGMVRSAGSFVWAKESKSQYVMAAFQAGGAPMEVQIDTRSSDPEAVNTTYVELFPLYIASSAKMGQLVVECVSGCTCARAVFDANMAVLLSFTMLQEMVVTQHPACVLRMSVGNVSTSGGYTVKVVGLAVGGVAVSKTAGTQAGSAAPAHTGPAALRSLRRL